MDEGKNWTELTFSGITDPKTPNHLPWLCLKSGITFINATTGWATANTAEIGIFPFYVTHDGGITWQHQNLAWPKGLIEPVASILPPIFFGMMDYSLFGLSILVMPGQQTAPSPAVFAPCEAQQLSLTFDKSGAALGNDAAQFVLTNQSQESCTLTGYPSLQLLDARHQPIHV
jgi:hypothetical protein